MLGPYRIERLLGRGGMGEVYGAEHVEHGRRVALKVLNQRLAGAGDRARFLREGQLAASLNHPNTVYVFGSEEINGTPVIAMELVAGGTLKDVVDRDGPMAPPAAVDAILQVVAGLEAAFARGFLHRDVKPSNCFVEPDGTVKVGDFGLSIPVLAPEVTQPGEVATFQGTPQFAPPEQLRGERLDARADICAVGATLSAFLFRGGLLLRLLGRAVVSPGGTEVSRTRAAWRAAVAWSPVLLLWIYVWAAPRGGRDVLDALALWPLPAAAAPVALAGSAWAVHHPARGMAERLTATHLVPR